MAAWRLRFISEDGSAHGTRVSAVDEDGSEVPVDYVINRVELVCDAEDGLWRGQVWVEVPASRDLPSNMKFTMRAGSPILLMKSPAWLRMPWVVMST